MKHIQCKVLCLLLQAYVCSSFLSGENKCNPIVSLLSRTLWNRLIDEKRLGISYSWCYDSVLPVSFIDRSMLQLTNRRSPVLKFAPSKTSDTILQSMIALKDNSDGDFIYDNDEIREDIETSYLALPQNRLENNRDNDLIQLTAKKLILSAAIQAGASAADIRSITFKPGKIVVIVDGSRAFLNTQDDYDDLENDHTIDLDLIDEDVCDCDNQMNTIQTTKSFMSVTETERNERSFKTDRRSNQREVYTEQPKHAGIDLVVIARSINEALSAEGEGSIGYDIAVQNEIEVTTPGASDVLSGIMFDSYRGFDVYVHMKPGKEIDSQEEDSRHKIPISKDLKIIEGKLIERTDDFLIINQKGRNKKIKNELVESVKLSKTKKERRGK